MLLTCCVRFEVDGERGFISRGACNLRSKSWSDVRGKNKAASESKALWVIDKGFRPEVFNDSNNGEFSR